MFEKSGVVIHFSDNYRLCLLSYIFRCFSLVLARISWVI